MGLDLRTCTSTPLLSEDMKDAPFSLEVDRGAELPRRLIETAHPNRVLLVLAALPRSNLNRLLSFPP